MLKLSKLIMMAAWVSLIPIRPALAAIMVLPLIDLVLGLICAARVGRPLTSAGIKRTIAKIVMYEVATLLAFVVETNLTGDLVPAVKAVTGLVGLTELKSCLEHLDELNGSPLFGLILNKLAPPQPKDDDK